MQSLASCDENEEILEYAALLEGNLNGACVRVSGEGRINETRGITQGEYLLHEVPEDFDPLFLTAVLITGYPNACANLDESPNPFSGRSYQYQRQLTFSADKQLRLRAQCMLD